MAEDISYQLNCFICVDIGDHCYATRIKIHIHLIALDLQVYREIKLIAVTLMTSGKTHAPELKMISEDFYSNDKAPL